MKEYKEPLDIKSPCVTPQKQEGKNQIQNKNYIEKKWKFGVPSLFPKEEINKKMSAIIYDLCHYHTVLKF